MKIEGYLFAKTARLQNFPDNFIFKGSLMHIQQQIGECSSTFISKGRFLIKY